MTYSYHFDFQYGSLQGTCSGVSFAQALDRARLDVLRQRGVRVGDYKFRIEKSRFDDQPFRFKTSERTVNRYRQLFRGFQQGQLREQELEELRQMQTILQDKDHFNEVHDSFRRQGLAPLGG